MANEETAVAEQPEAAVANRSSLPELDALKSMEEGPVLTGEYIAIEPGEELRAYVVGTKKIQALGGKEGEMTTAIMLYTEDGRHGINADKVVVSSLADQADLVNKGEKPLGSVAVVLKCTGKSKSGKGEYKDYDIRLLV